MLNDDYKMLADHRREIESWALRCHQRRELPGAFGEFIAHLCVWDWFLTITFRDRRRDWEWRPQAQHNLWSGQKRRVTYRRVLSESSPKERDVSPPTHDEAMHELSTYFDDIQQEAGMPIQWMLAEEFGKAGGRFHCHGAVGGVKRLNRRFWWAEAFRRFGRTRIEPFDPERGAAFYAAKYAAKQLGAIHFGGTIAGVVLSDCELPSSAGGKQTVMYSADLEKQYYGPRLGRWHR
ncbi:MAG: hypothetical protein ABSE79_10200 [Terriglobia bacterium]|jgi:hypothetical protein